MKALALLMLLSSEDPRLQGSAFMGPELRQMQQDEAANPAMLAVLDGADEWKKSCQSCHGDAAVSMRGVAVRYPAFDAKTNRPISLGARIIRCKGGAWKPESAELLAMEAFVGKQSRGMPLAQVDDPELAPWLKQGESLYNRRAGQLDLSCADCHDANWGKSLGGSTIPQAHPTGYPIYRLEWQAVGSLQRRLRNCISGMRAIVPPYESDPLLELALYLRQRAAGMVSETPGVRP